MDSTPNLFASGSDDATIKVCQRGEKEDQHVYRPRRGCGGVLSLDSAHMQARPPSSYPTGLPPAPPTR